MFLSQRKHTVDDNGALINHKKRTIDDYLVPRKKPYKPWLVFFVLVVLAVIAWFGVSSYQAFSKIITENKSNVAPFLSFFDTVKPEQLQGEGDSRINILLIGIGGAGHPGGQLADTIQVISIDPTNNKLAALSLPRDLYVPVANTKYFSKINRVHADGEAQKEGQGPVILKETISNILDLPIHYYIKLDFSGFKELIDELGGVDVDVDKSISDPYYPAEDMIGYQPFYLTAGKHHMNGTTALKYARSRETTSDFDRSRRQQQIMLAVKNQALSLGVLANPTKMSALVSILGKHLRTDLQLKEIELLAKVFKEINPSEITSKVLDNSVDGPLVSSVSSDGAYILQPKTGNFKDVARIAHEIFTDPYLDKENARLEVLNGSNTVGLGKEANDMLKSYGYNVVNLDKASKVYSKSVIYDYSGGQDPYTVKFLQDRFSAEVIKQPANSNSNIDITLIVGDDYAEN